MKLKFNIGDRVMIRDLPEVRAWRRGQTGAIYEIDGNNFYYMKLDDRDLCDTLVGVYENCIEPLYVAGLSR